MKYFQLMSGDRTRDFSQVMLDFGVAIVGPGKDGPLVENRDVYSRSDHWAKLSWLEEVSEGDRIIMHSGQSTIQSVGEVQKVGDSIYQYSDCFSDVDGWDLRHFCFVQWKEITLSLAGRPLSRSTAQRLHNSSVITLIENLWSTAQEIKPIYNKNLPSATDFVSSEEIEQFLVDRGLRIEDAENTVNTLSRVEKLAKWYQKQGPNFPTTEHEIRSFVVVPLLYALGWSHQRMAVEFHNMDILLFDDAARKRPRILFETKSLWSGSVLGLEQATSYLNSKKQLLEGLKKVVITDGLTYWLYDSNNMSTPIAYMSFKSKRRKNPAYPSVGGLLEFIGELIP